MYNFSIKEFKTISEWFRSVYAIHSNFLEVTDWVLYFKISDMIGTVISTGEIEDYNMCLKNEPKTTDTLTQSIVENLKLYNDNCKIKYNGKNKPLSIVPKD